MGLNIHSAFLLNDNTVRTIGFNSYGQCGTGSITPSNQLTLYNILNLTNVKQISCGAVHTVFLLNDGTVKAVGDNRNGQCGTGNITSPQLTLYTIPGLSNVKQVICGYMHTVFLLNDGTVKTIGSNDNGQCGTGTKTTPQLTLYTIPSLTNIKQVACGNSHTVFLLNDGTVKAVGRNDYGQCGTGNTTSPQLTLYTIPGLSNVKQVICGDSHTVFLLNDGTVKTIGLNSSGQCGTGTITSSQLTLFTIPSLTNVKSIACGTNHSVFLLNDGTVRTVGNNGTGQCGTGSITPTNQLTLYVIPSLSNVKQITCGSGYTVFLLNDGTVKTVGDNSYGQCGNSVTVGGNQLTLFIIPSLSNVTSAWDILNNIIIKYLIYQYNNYYSIKSAYYSNNNYFPLTLSGGSLPNKADIELYGFNSISDLITSTTIGTETFKPIDKINNNFQIKMYKSK